MSPTDTFPPDDEAWLRRMRDTASDAAPGSVRAALLAATADAEPASSPRFVLRLTLSLAAVALLVAGLALWGMRSSGVDRPEAGKGAATVESVDAAEAPMLLALIGSGEDRVAILQIGGGGGYRLAQADDAFGAWRLQTIRKDTASIVSGDTVIDLKAPANAVVAAHATRLVALYRDSKAGPFGDAAWRDVLAWTEEGDVAAIALLETIAENRKDPRFSDGVVANLYGEPELRGTILRLAGVVARVEHEGRSHAVSALGRFSCPVSRMALLRVVRNPADPLRVLAVRALAGAGTPADAAALEALLQETGLSAELQREAAKSLQQIRAREAK